MSGTQKTNDGQDIATAMETLFDSVSRAGGPVLVEVEGKGRLVVMPEGAYAELLDCTQKTTTLDLDADPLIASLRVSAAG